MSDERVQTLIQRYFDRCTEEGDIEELESILSTSAEARSAFREIGKIHGLLNYSVQMELGRHAANKDLILPLLQKQTPPPSGKRQQPLRHWAIAGIGIAACLGIFASLAQLGPKGSKATPAAVTPGLASITSKGPIEWAASSTKPRGAQFDAGVYTLDFGSLRFLMGAGAQVSIAAPCHFELLSNKLIRVDYGRLTARLPDDENELVVTMPGLTLTDLGTGFGVDVEKSGKSLVSVFEGKVKLEEEQDAAATILKAGGSIRHTSGESHSLKRLKFDPTPFRDLWPLTLGIEDASDLVNFAPPGPGDRTLFSYQDADHVFLLPERQSITLEEPLIIDLSAADSTWPNSSELSSIPAGSRVSSYLVFYNPPKGLKVPVRNLRGSINFNREILGVICTAKPLSISDKILGIALRGNELSGRRQLERDDGIEGGLPHDTVTLSSDKRSIHFDFSAREGIDNIRILLSDD